MKIITAIVRTSTLESIVNSLERLGITGMTIGEVKGLGQGVSLYKPYTVHSRIELILPDARVDDVKNVILDHAHTGFAGDGIVAVLPVDEMIKIRTRERRE